MTNYFKALLFVQNPRIYQIRTSKFIIEYLVSLLLTHHQISSLIKSKSRCKNIKQQVSTLKLQKVTKCTKITYKKV